MNSEPHDSNSRDIDEVLLTAYALDQLGASERAAVEGQLARNDRARRFVQQIRGLAEHVTEANRQGPAAEPSPALREAVEDRLSQLEEVKMRATQRPSRSNRRQRARRVLGLLVAAACLLIAAVPLYQATVGDRLAGRRQVAAVSPVERTASPQFDKAAVAGDEATAGTELLVDDSTSMTALELSPPDQLGGPDSPETEPFGTVTGHVLGVRQGRYPSTSPAPTPVQPPAGQPGYPLGDYGGTLNSGIALGEPASGALQPGKGAVHGWPHHANGPAAYSTTPSPQVRPHAEPPAAPPVVTNGADYTPRYVRNTGPYQPPTQSSAGTPPQPADELAWRRPDVAGGERVVTEAVETTTDLHRQSNFQIPGTEQYEAIVENDFVRAMGKKALSTFSVDVDTASYANVRRFLSQGRLPPPAAVRIEEMINYFSYDYPLPTGDVPFAVNMEVAQCPWNVDHRLLRVGLKGQEIHREERPPGNLVFLLDVSGSMRDANKLPLVKHAMRLLAKQLTEDDRVAIVTYANSAGVQLESTGGHQRQLILDAIDALSAAGSTHGSAGIELAYQQAVEHFVDGGTNRVILATDGDLNVGITEDDQLVRLIQDKAKSGVFLTVLGFGTGNLKDAKLEKLADKGNGAYAYVDDLSEAHKVLVEQMTGSLVTIAKDVKVQIEFNPAEVHSYRLIGYENRGLAAREFDDDKKDAGEIGAGHTVTALYEIVPARGERPAGGEETGLKYQRPSQRDLTAAARSGELATLKLRYKLPEAAESTKLEYVVKDTGKRFGEASGEFRFAAAVASFGMLLRGSPHAGKVTLSAVEEFAAGALGDDPGGYRAEFVDLVRQARQLSAR